MNIIPILKVQISLVKPEL